MFGIPLVRCTIKLGLFSATFGTLLYKSGLYLVVGTSIIVSTLAAERALEIDELWVTFPTDQYPFIMCL